MRRPNERASFPVRSCRRLLDKPSSSGMPAQEQDTLTQMARRSDRPSTAERTRYTNYPKHPLQCYAEVSAVDNSVPIPPKADRMSQMRQKALERLSSWAATLTCGPRYLNSPAYAVTGCLVEGWRKRRDSNPRYPFRYAS